MKKVFQNPVWIYKSLAGFHINLVDFWKPSVGFVKFYKPLEGLHLTNIVTLFALALYTITSLRVSIWLHVAFMFGRIFNQKSSFLTENPSGRNGKNWLQKLRELSIFTLRIIFWEHLVDNLSKFIDLHAVVRHVREIQTLKPAIL